MIILLILLTQNIINFPKIIFNFYQIFLNLLRLNILQKCLIPSISYLIYYKFQLFISRFFIHLQSFNNLCKIKIVSKDHILCFSILLINISLGQISYLLIRLIDLNSIRLYIIFDSKNDSNLFNIFILIFGNFLILNKFFTNTTYGFWNSIQPFYLNFSH